MASVMIVDDHPVTREGLIMRLEIERDLTVCGQAEDESDGFALAMKLQPDIAVVDIALKIGSGLELIKQLKTSCPRTRILTWSLYDESLFAERALRAGALGYINKQTATNTIVEAIRCVLSGQVYLSDEMSKKMLSRVSKGSDQLIGAPCDVLSDREMETFVWIGRGKNTASIAEAMNLSPKTIETYRSRIKEKLALEDMASLAREAAHWVLENG